MKERIIKWKSLDENYQISDFGDVYLNRSKKMAVGGLNHYGYKQVTINKIPTTVHRLVAKMFLPNPENKADVNHINGIKTDNRKENLEWCTRSYNTLHQWKNGLVNTRGENNAKSKLKEKQVIKIKKLYKTGKYSQAKLASTYNVSQPHIGDIILGQIWKYLI